MTRYPNEDVARFDQQFAEDFDERAERQAKQRTLKNQSGDLIVVPTAPQDALAMFAGEYDTAIAPLLKPIALAVTAFLMAPPDASIESGREAIKEFGRKLVKSRTLLESVGKSVADEIKRLPKIVDANRKAARDQLEEWERLVRADLEAWESKEAARIADHVKAIAAISELGTRTLPGDLALTAVEIKAELDGLSAPDAPEEFADEYRIAIAAARERLGAQIMAREQYERDQAELAALRASQARQKAIDDAAALERAELARKAANEQAEIERQLRIKADAEAEAERKERKRLEAEAFERKRIEDKTAADKADAERLARHKSHQARIDREAAQAIDAFSGTLSPYIIAVDIVRAIKMGKIPHVTINY